MPKDDVAFLREAARYFRKQDAAEDRAFWANNQNADNLERIAAELSALQGGMGEPVAWMDPDYLSGQPYKKYTSPVVAARIKEWVPLYTAPVPPAPDRLRKALEEIAELTKRPSEPPWQRFIDLANIVDKVHEIARAALAEGGETDPGKFSLAKRPVAFRVKDHADGWIIVQDEEAANREADATGALVQGLYVRDGTPLHDANPSPDMAARLLETDMNVMTDDEWAMVEPYLEPNTKLVKLLDDKDRVLAKAILRQKQHLGPLGMIEVGIVLGRILRTGPPPPDIAAKLLEALLWIDTYDPEIVAGAEKRFGFDIHDAALAAGVKVEET